MIRIKNKAILTLAILAFFSTSSSYADTVDITNINSKDYRLIKSFLDKNEQTEDKVVKYIIKDDNLYLDKELKNKKSKLYAGQRVDVKKDGNAYFVINYKGYINPQSLSDKLDFKKIEGEFEAGKLTNIYEKPDISSKIVGKLLTGEKESYSEKLESWIKIQRNNETGYILDLEDEKEVNNDDNKNTVDIEENLDNEVSIEDTNISNEQTDTFSNTQNYESSYANQIMGNNSQVISDNTNSDTGLNRVEMVSNKGKHVYVDYNSERQRDIVKMALSYEGGRYIWGGNSLSNGVDCSGFTRELYKRFGYLLPRTSFSQRFTGKLVPFSKLQAGDLIHFPGHVGMYIGSGKMIHASSPTTGIIITNLNYGHKNMISATRIFE